MTTRQCTGLVLIILVTASLLASDAPQSADAPAAAVSVSGSSTLGPIADAFAAYFKKQGRDAKYTVKKTGSGDGAAALISGTCDIATMSRALKPEEYAKAVKNGVYPMHHVIAMDGVAVIVHSTNTVAGLSLEQLRKIYTGEITNWKALGGANLPIVALSRDTSSGTYETFYKLVMDGKAMGETLEFVNVSPQFHGRVSTTPGAIAYVGLGFVDDKVKALNIDGVAPSADTIRSGTYPISRRLFMVTNGPPKLGSAVHEFIQLALTKAGHTLIEQKGFIPCTEY